MASEDILLRLKLIDEFSATLKKYQTELRGAEQQSAQASQKMTRGFGELKGVMQAVAGAAVTGALIDGLRRVVNAAAEAEQVQARLGAALRATGKYSGEAVSGVNAWASSMLQFKGVSDELAVSLVAEGVAMGKTVEQSQRLAEAAANMAPIVGSVEGAFSLLVRASNGSTEALKRYGIEVSEAEAKSGDFESILRRIEERFAGQAEANLKTYNGQIAQLKENFGNLAESIGNQLLPVANEWLGWINKAITDYQRLGAATEDLDKKQLLLLRNQLAAKEMALQGGLISIGGGNLGDTQEAIKRVDAALLALAEKNKAARAAGGAGSIFAPTKQGAPAKEALLDDAAIAFAKQGLYEVGGAFDYASKKADELREKSEAALRARANLATSDMGSGQALSVAEYQAQLQVATESVTDPLVRLGAEFDEEARRAQYRQQAQESLDKTLEESTRAGKDAAKAADARTASDMAAAQAAYSFAQALVSFGMALRAGNTGGVLSSLGTMGMMGGAAIASPWLFGVGAAASLTGGLIQPGTPRTYGGQSRNDLQNLFQDVGLTDKTAKTADLALTGLGDFYKSLGLFILGVSKDFGSAGEIVYGKLRDLNLSLYETADAAAYVKAQNEDLTMAEARRGAALAALFSLNALTIPQLSEMVDLYRQGTTWTERYNAIVKEMNEDIERAAKAQKGSSEEARWLAELEKDRAAYIELLRADLAAKEEWKARLEEEGLSAEDQARAANGIDASNKWLEIIARNTGSGTGGGGGGGGGGGEMYASRASYTRREGVLVVDKVIVNGAVGDHRDIAKKLHAELRTLLEFGEVNN